MAVENDSPFGYWAWPKHFPQGFGAFYLALFELAILAGPSRFSQTHAREEDSAVFTKIVVFTRIKSPKKPPLRRGSENIEDLKVRRAHDLHRTIQKGWHAHRLAGARDARNGTWNDPGINLPTYGSFRESPNGSFPTPGRVIPSYRSSN